MNVAAVVLAAGASSRMGFPKALLPLGGSTFLETILDTLDAAGLGCVHVVVGGDAPRVSAVAERCGGHPLHNPDFALGQISSIRIALAALDPSVDACLFWPVDQPAVSAVLVRRLVEMQAVTGAPVVLPLCDGRRGHPAVIARRLFPELAAVTGALGAKPVMERHRAATVLVETAERGTIEDVDTPEDYRRLTGETPAGALARAAGQAQSTPWGEAEVARRRPKGRDHP